MSLGLAYWILMLVWLVFGFIGFRAVGTVGWPLIGGNVLLFVLLGLIGWKVFGPPLHG